MSKSEKSISDLRKMAVEYLETKNPEFAMMSLRMLEKQCRVMSDDENLLFSLEEQANILKESGDQDRSNQLLEEAKNLRQKIPGGDVNRVAKEIKDTSSHVVRTHKHYRLMSCGSIVDTKTHLEWYVESDVRMSWFQVESWVEHLKDCGGGWRMPTISELKSLYEKGGGGGQSGNMDQIFPKAIGFVVWSGDETGEEEGWKTVHAFDFQLGVPHKLKARTSRNVLAVRSMQIKI